MKLIDMVKAVVKTWPDEWGFITQDPHNKTLYVSGKGSVMQLDPLSDAWMVGDKGSWVCSLGRQLDVAEDVRTAVITKDDLFPVFTGEVLTGTLKSSNYETGIKGFSITVDPFRPGDFFKYLVNDTYHICKVVYYGDEKMAWLDTTNENQIDSIDDYKAINPVKIDAHAAQVISMANDIADTMQRFSAAQMHSLPRKLALDIADELLCTYDIREKGHEN